MRSCVSIRSAHDGTRLALSQFVGQGGGADADTFVVSIERQDVRVEASASAFMAQDLGQYFEELASNWRGWQGRKEWSTLEGEFTLSATSDSTGHIALAYFLRPPHTGFHWELRDAVELEAGQLQAIAQEMKDAWSCYAQSAA
jgi:Family of unknown function (DUF6228)